jgi:transposase-like protein
VNIGLGSTEEFVSKEFASLELKDKRLNKRAKTILKTLQNTLTTCVRRMSADSKDVRQTYDFFFQPQNNKSKVNGTSLCEYSRTH